MIPRVDLMRQRSILYELWRRQRRDLVIEILMLPLAATIWYIVRLSFLATIKTDSYSFLAVYSGSSDYCSSLLCSGIR